MVAPPTDAALLRAFALERSQEAFRQLVERHQSMVYGAARRKLGSDAAAADVAQAVFAALAAKAAWLSGRSNVGGWLYKATLMEAARRLRDDARRFKRERLYAEDMNTTHGPPDPNDPLQRALPILDDALSDLGSADREAIMLRFFQGLSLRETGSALGTTEEAARKRVSRALEKLASVFTRRGVAVPAAVLSAVILPKAGAVPPAAFATQTALAASTAPGTGVGGALYLKWLGLSQAQVAAACLAATALPIGWQAHRISTLQAEKTVLSGEIAALRPAPPPPQLPDMTPRFVTAMSGSERDVADGKPGPPDPRTDRRGRRGDIWEIQRKQERDARALALNDELALSPVQHAAVVAAMERADAARSALFERSRAENRPVTPEELTAITTEREGAIQSQLDDEQKLAYGHFIEAEKQNRQEIFANRMLTEVQSALHLSDTQKDELFALFAAQAAASPDQMASWRGGPDLMSAEHLEQLQSVLTEEQFTLWRQRMETWGQFFRRPPSPGK